MSTYNTTEAKPRIEQNCNKCSAQGFPDQKIGFVNNGTDPATGKTKWKLVEADPSSPLGYKDHTHKGVQKSYGGGTYSKFKRIIDIAFITDVQEARKLLALGWDYQTAFPTTPVNTPTIVMVKKEA